MAGLRPARMIRDFCKSCLNLTKLSYPALEDSLKTSTSPASQKAQICSRQKSKRRQAQISSRGTFSDARIGANRIPEEPKTKSFPFQSEAGIAMAKRKTWAWLEEMGA